MHNVARFMHLDSVAVLPDLVDMASTWAGPFFGCCLAWVVERGAVRTR
jgi:hypothetical protein